MIMINSDINNTRIEVIILKKFILFFTLVAMLAISSIVSAYENEPNGFRNLTWGMTYDETAKIYPNNTNVSEYSYQLADFQIPYLDIFSFTIDNPFVYDIPIENTLVACFYKNKLYSITLKFTNINDFATFSKNQEHLNTQLRNLYGNPTYMLKHLIIPEEETIHTNYSWFGKNTNIFALAQYNLFIDSTKCPDCLTLVFTSVDINNEMLSDQLQSYQDYQYYYNSYNN